MKSGLTFMLRHLVISFVAILLMSSCSNTFEFIERLLEGPPLYFQNQQTTLSDSLKIHFKGDPTKSLDYAFSLTPLETGELDNVTVKIEGGNPTLVANGNVVTDQFKAIKGKESNLVLTPEGVDATYVVTFASRSTTGKVTEKVSVLTLVVFKNYPPVASFSINPVIGTKDYQFNASKSYDRDAKFGGLIKTYTYTVKGPNEYLHTITVNKPIIRYAFPSLGNFTVELKINDNDGGVSEVVSQSINITG